MSTPPEDRVPAGESEEAMTYTDTTTIGASVRAVHEVLVDVGGVAGWNPAFSSMAARGRAVVGDGYPVTVRGILPGEVRYLEITDRLVRTAWTFPGFAEESSWRLEPAVGATRVTHTFTHTGPIAALLSRGFAQAAGLRLGRLADEVRRRSTARRQAA